ncbi:MAG: OmpW family protein [Acetobacter sp.]|nr:OmpW family protein [Acetobacter sp.]
MTKIRSFFTSLTAMAVGAISFASTTDVAKAQTHNTNPYVNAAVMSHIPNAPRSKGSCGIFETCASTEHGLGKGNFMVGLSAVYIMPQDRNQRIWFRDNNNQYLAIGQGGGGLLPGPNVIGAGTHGAYITTTNPVMPELNLRYFITDHISVGLIATSSRTQVEAYNVPTVNHSLNVGTIWVLPPTLTFAWHFLPHRRFNPYVGLGANIDWFHNGTGNLSYPGESAEVGAKIGMPQLNAGFTGGPSLNAGFDYQLVGNWFFNLDIKQMFVRMHAWAKGGLLDDTAAIDGLAGPNSQIKVHESLDPTVVSAGIAYRFF